MKTSLLPVKHSEFVLSRLNSQRNKGLFCDAVLIVEGEQFQTHKSFLAANSDYFLSLFSSAKEQGNFVLAGVPLRGFRVLLDFIYTSSFVINSQNVYDVHKAATALGFRHVTNACEKVYRNIHLMKKSNSCCNVSQQKTALIPMRKTAANEEPEDLTKHKTEYQDLRISSSTKPESVSDSEATLAQRIRRRESADSKSRESPKPQDLSLTHKRNLSADCTKTEKEKHVSDMFKISCTTADGEKDNLKPENNPLSRPFVDLARKRKTSSGLKRKAIDDVLVVLHAKDKSGIKAVKSSHISKDLQNRHKSETLNIIVKNNH